ncbi:MAG: GNAT family N-acetyltransferase [Hyphomicrobiaceae bacterium]
MIRDAAGAADMPTLADIEQAAVRSWPALESEAIDGWLARCSSGGSTRANTVSALRYSGGDPERSLAAVEDFYRARGVAARFTMTEVDQPPGLDGLLAARGWRRSGEHVTMVKPIELLPAGKMADPPNLTIRLDDDPTSSWLGIYLDRITENRRAAAPRIIAGVPRPRIFLSCMRDGTVIGSGLTVIDGPLASVQCMATSRSSSRTGAARLILEHIQVVAAAQGCRALYLQAEAENIAALTLYQSEGFHVAGRYHVREANG